MPNPIDIINKMDRAMYDVQLYLTDDTSLELVGRLEALADMLNFLAFRLEVEYAEQKFKKELGHLDGKEEVE